METVFDDIRAERKRQEELKCAGKFPWTCSAVGPSLYEKLTILAEEFGEVSKEVCETIGYQTDGQFRMARIKTELIQVAAVCVAWVQALNLELKYPEIGKRVQEMEHELHQPVITRKDW